MPTEIIYILGGITILGIVVFLVYKITKFNSRLATLIVGWGTATTTAVIIDEVLWTPAILWLGPITGGIVMTIIALVVNITLIWAYDTLKRDFLSFEALREMQENDQKGFWKKLLVKALKAGKIPAFFALSLYDPFLAVIFFRKGVNSYKMTKRDWLNFVTSMIIACLGWTIICSTFAWVIKLVWGYLFV